jgi:hypothetical protein
MTIAPLGEHKKTIKGYEWRCFQGKISESLSEDPNIKSHAAALRASQFSQFEVLIASIGRPQKIDNDDFIKMLSIVLKSNHQVAFLWFGKEELISVKNRMRHYGIEQQCFFQGWVDSKLYANLIDIHLDSFPFPTGFTARETMAVGCPNVFMYNESSYYTLTILSSILPFLEKQVGTQELQNKITEIFYDENGCLLLSMADSIEKYAEETIRLINDSGFRKKVGNAGKRFIMEIIENEQYLAESFIAHIEEITSH